MKKKTLKLKNIGKPHLDPKLSHHLTDGIETDLWVSIFTHLGPNDHPFNTGLYRSLNLNLGSSIRSSLIEKSRQP
jgi:hypothetical protein